MSLNNELHDLFERVKDAPWPGERQAFDRFLRRKVRRGRAIAVGVALSLAALVAAAMLVPRMLPSGVEQVVPVAPGGPGMRIVDQGFQVAPPAGWKISRKITRALGPMPYDGQLVLGVVLTPSSGESPVATLTVTAQDREPSWRGASRRPDGRQYLWQPTSDRGGAGQYTLEWRDYCNEDRAMAITTCDRAGQARVLLVTGKAPDDAQAQEQLQQAMRQLTLGVEPITNAIQPPPTPTVAPATRAPLGRGGSGATSWEMLIEPSDPSGNVAGLAVRFPEATPNPIRRWKELKPSILNGHGTATVLECVSGKTMVVGLARADVAMVQIELSKRPVVEVPVFSDTRSLPLAAFASPPLSGRKVLVNRATAFTAAGKMIGTENLRAVAPCRGS